LDIEWPPTPQVLDNVPKSPRVLWSTLARESAALVAANDERGRFGSGVVRRFSSRVAGRFGRKLGMRNGPVITSSGLERVKLDTLTGISTGNWDLGGWHLDQH
jgi:hypothetical protein